MEVKPGYKQTEVGIIPKEWGTCRLRDLVDRASPIAYGVLKPGDYIHDGVPLLQIRDVIYGEIDIDQLHRISEELDRQYSRTKLVGGEIVISLVGTIGRAALLPVSLAGGNLHRNLARIHVSKVCDSKFIYYFLNSDCAQAAIKLTTFGSTQALLNLADLRNLQFLVPPVPEQRAIATALSDVDGLLGGLDRLIAKKRDLKQAAMQQLLTGQTRLPGFHGEWEVKTLGEITDSLDNLRVPLNEAQREKMQGDYPYCGANGVLGFVDSYVIDDDIILMAEDGGYFDEYETRPIAYRMTGKCWVNNHAHILKSKPGFDQGFLFYSLVHKNILPFLASGTRAKLNKSEMNKIEVRQPKEQPEQTAIAEVLTEMDAELVALEQRREKTRALKQAMMQELLTGRTRLV